VRSHHGSAEGADAALQRPRKVDALAVHGHDALLVLALQPEGVDGVHLQCSRPALRLLTHRHKTRLCLEAGQVQVAAALQGEQEAQQGAAAHAGRAHQRQVHAPVVEAAAARQVGRAGRQVAHVDHVDQAEVRLDRLPVGGHRLAQARHPHHVPRLRTCAAAPATTGQNKPFQKFLIKLGTQKYSNISIFKIWHAGNT